jgi:hypothetical protein
MFATFDTVSGLWAVNLLAHKTYVLVDLRVLLEFGNMKLLG